MTERSRDEGGEAPCFAHLADEDDRVSDPVLAQLAVELADALVLADADGTIVFWNDAAALLFGWPASEAIGQSLDLVIPSRLRERHWTGYAEVMTSGQTKYGSRLLEVPALHRDGRRLSIAFTVTLLSRPGETRPFAIAAVVRDDTERWQERRQLNDELARLRAAQTPPPDPPG